MDLFVCCSLNPTNPFYKQRMTSFLSDWFGAGPWVKYTPKGLAFTGTWGSLRHTGNGVFLAEAYAARAADAPKDKVHCLTLKQLGYILGDAGRSFVVGYGVNPPQQAHHRAASCPDRPTTCSYNDFNSPSPNPHVLYGAVVGGPDGSDTYQDQRNNFVQNEVATDYNAGFQGALAAAIQSRAARNLCA
jgi:endoglucanase